MTSDNLDIMLPGDRAAVRDIAYLLGGYGKGAAAETLYHIADDEERRDIERQSIAERKLRLQAIVPPETPDYPGNEPRVFAVQVLGVDLIAVNWVDFKGWEVRRRATFAGEAGLLLGWVRGPVDDKHWVANAVRPTPADTGPVDSFGEGLVFLVEKAGLA